MVGRCVKILTGSLRGREIYFKANPHLRPTADKIRKAIFDILGDAIQDAKVLDLFSGTGALGLEALSGGAQEAVFVENDKKQAAKIAENLKALRLEKRGRVLCMDAAKAVQTFHNQGEIFDLIFLDPPYNEGWEKKTAEVVAAHPILSKRSWVLMESSAKNVASPSTFGGLAKVKEKNYGDTRLVFYGEVISC